VHFVGYYLLWKLIIIPFLAAIRHLFAPYFCAVTGLNVFIHICIPVSLTLEKEVSCSAEWFHHTENIFPLLSLRINSNIFVVSTFFIISHCLGLWNNHYVSAFKNPIKRKPVTICRYLCVMNHYVWNAVPTFQTMLAVTVLDLWITSMHTSNDVHPNTRCEKTREKFISISFSHSIQPFVLFVILYRPM
jgi:hypothetical protein